ncbi:MAG: hypothetical protein J6V15_07060 [Clostridia bacterium]|nr:hypothetical protein [Clostridia bacterium]
MGWFVLLFVPFALGIVFVLRDAYKLRTATRRRLKKPPTHTSQAPDEPPPPSLRDATPADDPVVLIGSLSSEHQLSVCLSEGFYHIPAAIAGKDYRRIDYVAIYQSRRFFGAAAGIRYYARVISARVLPRHEIQEIPRQSSMPYVRFELGEWQILPVPIAPKGKGVTSARCTLSRLRSADNMYSLLKR